MVKKECCGEHWVTPALAKCCHSHPEFSEEERSNVLTGLSQEEKMKSSLFIFHFQLCIPLFCCTKCNLIVITERSWRTHYQDTCRGAAEWAFWKSWWAPGLDTGPIATAPFLLPVRKRCSVGCWVYSFSVAPCMNVETVPKVTSSH